MCDFRAFWEISYESSHKYRLRKIWQKLGANFHVSFTVNDGVCDWDSARNGIIYFYGTIHINVKGNLTSLSQSQTPSLSINMSLKVIDSFNQCVCSTLILQLWNSNFPYILQITPTLKVLLGTVNQKWNLFPNGLIFVTRKKLMRCMKCEGVDWQGSHRKRQMKRKVRPWTLT